MSNKPNPRRFKVSEFAAERNKEAAIEVETDDGSVFVIPASECWPDDFPWNGTDVAQAKAVLGDDEFDRYIAAGGTARLLNAIFAHAQGS